MNYGRELCLRFDPSKEYVIGAFARERRGAGVVDLKLLLRRRDDDGERETSWLLNDEDVSGTHEIRLDGAGMVGILVKQYANEGIVDVKFLA